MRKFLLPVLVLVLIIASGTLPAQIKPIVRKATYFDKTKPLREMKMYKPGEGGQHWKDNEIRNEIPERDIININPLPVGPDPLWQRVFGQRRSAGPFMNFEGVGNINGVYPPDTEGDVSGDYYFQMINLAFEIYDKEGNSIYGPAANRTLWNGFIGPW